MSDDFSVLLEFLDQTGPEVQGRGLAGLSPEQVSLMDRFIAGGCSAAERYDLARFLQLNPAWIRRIADRVKTARDGAGPSAMAAR